MYNEILKLKEMLTEKDVPLEFKPLYDGYMIVIYNSNRSRRLCDAVEHFASYGSEDDLIEIQGAMIDEELQHDTVLGNLTAEEVCKRFVYCYKNNTLTYKA